MITLLYPPEIKRLKCAMLGAFTVIIFCKALKQPYDLKVIIRADANVVGK